MRGVDGHLRAILLRQRGDNRKLAEEVICDLSDESKERLFRVLMDMKGDAENERRKRRSGQWS
jgi:hypothetical protein